MKFVLAIVALAILGVGYWLVTNKDVDHYMDDNEMEEAINMESSDNMEHENMNDDEDGLSASAELEVSADVSSGEVKVFEVSGKSFEYDITEIRVNQGDTVTINFVSSEGFHDWVVDEFDAATDRVQTGGTTSVTFVADKSGTFEYYCSVGSHREQGMVGSLVVDPV